MGAAEAKTESFKRYMDTENNEIGERKCGEQSASVELFEKNATGGRSIARGLKTILQIKRKILTAQNDI